jgi:hypothetical protein
MFTTLWTLCGGSRSVFIPKLLEIPTFVLVDLNTRNVIHKCVKGGVRKALHILLY